MSALRQLLVAVGVTAVVWHFGPPAVCVASDGTLFSRAGVEWCALTETVTETKRAPLVPRSGDGGMLELWESHNDAALIAEHGPCGLYQETRQQTVRLPFDWFWLQSAHQAGLAGYAGLAVLAASALWATVSAWRWITERSDDDRPTQ